MYNDKNNYQTGINMPTNKKPHTNHSIGLKQVLADIESVTTEVLERHNTLQGLSALIDDGVDSKSVLYLGDNIPIYTGESNGVMAQVANSITLVLQDNQGVPVTLASYSIEHPDNKPFIHDTAVPCAFVIGNMNPDSDWWCVDSIKESIRLYQAFNSTDDVTIITCVNPYQFNDVVKHFAEVKQININVPSNQQSRMLKQLAGVNAQLWATVLPIADCLNYSDLPSDIMQSPDTVMTDLSMMAWGELEPLANDTSKPTSYPLEAWGNGLLKKVVESIAYYSQVPHAMAGQCVLGALAHMGQRYINAPMGNGYMPTSLILITEGESGSGKSSAMKLSHAKINDYERQQYEHYVLMLNDWQKERAVVTGKELKEFLSTSPIPVSNQSLYKDSTIEPILDKYINGEIINASWSTDEAGQFFNSYTMKGDTAGSAMSSITQLHDGEGVNRNRSQKGANANPRTQAHDVRLTLFLMGQRVILEPALSDVVLNGQGILARGLISCPNSLQGSRIWNDPKRRKQSPYTDPTLLAYWDRCNSLLDPVASNNPDLGLIIDGRPNRINMQWADQETEQAFYDYYQAIENKQAKGCIYESLKSYASRMAENASRISSLLAFFDNRVTISIDDIKKAFLLVDHSMNERLRYLDITTEQSDSEKLIQWLVKYCKKNNCNYLAYSTAQSRTNPKHLRKKQVFEIIIDELQAKKHVKIKLDDNIRYIYLNPQLLG